jgi:hypothetical protein
MFWRNFVTVKPHWKLKLSHHTPWWRLGEEEIHLLLFLELSTRRGEWSASRLGRALAPGIEPRTPGRAVRSQTLYWLSYPAHKTSLMCTNTLTQGKVSLNYRSYQLDINIFKSLFTKGIQNPATCFNLHGNGMQVWDNERENIMELLILKQNYIKNSNNIEQGEHLDTVFVFRHYSSKPKIDATYYSYEERVVT